ncbi:F-box/SPRY domain-containing protein 1-like [Artemia franciscana]|uniref:F-box/SPRY domain-containing protein 1 n=1 Tax=Artemia franciscana TaxID=6661 RepID=A0AA88LA42_ARTSF|nr:hypothetical protein QYM36_005790 [Artemia franciscana]KAK2718574.1 hypothetical protein QYM36_005790 [Artemia franciscana]
MLIKNFTSILSLPEDIYDVIFAFLSLEDVFNCMQVCTRWCYILEKGNSEVWRHHSLKTLPSEALGSKLLSSLTSHKSRLKAFKYAWNPNDCSPHVYIKSNGFTLHRNPIAQSTDGARGKVGFKAGRHSWEITWEGPLGTVAVVGVATKDASLHQNGYLALLGSDDESWGWNLVDNDLFHSGEVQGNYPQFNNPPKYQIGDRIRVILDCEENTLAFEKHYEFLGVAFKGLPRKRLFPAVSAVYGHTEVSMVYLGEPLDG